MIKRTFAVLILPIQTIHQGPWPSVTLVHSTRCTAWAWWEHRTHTISSRWARMVVCVHGRWTCSLSLRRPWSCSIDRVKLLLPCVLTFRTMMSTTLSLAVRKEQCIQVMSAASTFKISLFLAKVGLSNTEGQVFWNLIPEKFKEQINIFKTYFWHHSFFRQLSGN